MDNETVVNSEAAASYARRFARLRTDKSHSRWTPTTLDCAPHKPILLLCVLDLFEQEQIRTNLIEVSPELGELFFRYWTSVLPFARRGNLALPFFHLQSEGFWRLLPRQGKEAEIGSASRMRSLTRLKESVIGASLDEPLYALCRVPQARHLLRSILVETYFALPVRNLIAEQSIVNKEAYLYSVDLLRRDKELTVGEALKEGYQPAARDQGFRQAVKTAYAHRCALCGLRVLTLDGRTVVDAAHIVPWSISHDDRPANGIALCRTCHWTFDEGLLSISRVYRIISSAQLRNIDSLAGYLADLEGRSAFVPERAIYRPDPRSLRWHREYVLRR